MRALLLAAGLGTRLRPLTNTVPKCLVPVKGTPLLKIWLDRLAAAGVESFLINTHHLAQQVKEFIDASPNRNQVTLIHESVLLGTAGTLISNLDFFGRQDGLLIHADNYCLADFNAFIRAHRQRPPECLLTMMTFRTDRPSACGIVETDSRGIVVGFHEKVESPPGNLANGAIYLLSAELMDKLRDEFSECTDFSNEIVSALIGKIFHHETREMFLDIGTPETYDAANSS